MGALTIVTLSLFHMNEPALVLFSGLFVASSLAARLRWNSLLQSAKPWLIFLIAVFLIQAFLNQPSLLFWESRWSLSFDAVRAAAIVCWRMALMLCYAILFTSVTRPREMQDALTWFLQPLPFIPARRIAVMINMTIRFFPVVLDQAQEIQMAIKSRLGSQSGKPLRRLKYYILPLFRRSFIHSDEIALALAARGYREDLPLRMPKASLHHVLALSVVALLALLAIFEATLWAHFLI
jgi:energy-coupling factor transporter transmembrane protein EcfT